MKIAETKKNGVVVCRPDGEVDINTSPELRKAFDEYIRSNVRKIVVDFSKVSYIDSSGLATLIELFQRLKKLHGSLRICNMSDKVRSIFEITKLHKLFEVYDTEEIAVKDF